MKSNRKSQLSNNHVIEKVFAFFRQIKVVVCLFFILVAVGFYLRLLTLESGTMKYENHAFQSTLLKHY